jgi:hypothetical protein
MSKLYSIIDTDMSKRKTARGNETITSHTSGWDLGVKVVAEIIHDGTEIQFSIYKTGGSNNSSPTELLQTITRYLTP